MIGREKYGGLRNSRSQATGRITGVTTKLNSGAAVVNVATSITYQPVSNLIKSLTCGNALTESAAHTLDYEQSQCTVLSGATPVSGFSVSRGDSLNITGLTDTVTGGNSQTLAYSAANRLNSASGAYGSKTWIFDGVGNRTSETSTPLGGAAVADSYTYPATNNKLQSIVRNAATVRSFTYDNAGNMATDVRSGITYAYTYNNANRLKTVSQAGNLLGTPVRFCSLMRSGPARLHGCVTRARPRNVLTKAENLALPTGVEPVFSE